MPEEFWEMIVLHSIVIIGFWVSGVFSCEFQLGADSVFFTSNYGRNRAIHVKIKAGFLVIMGVYWAAIRIFFLLVLGLFMSGGYVAHLFDFSDNIIVIPTGIC